MTSTLPASTNPFDMKVPEEPAGEMIEMTKLPNTNPFNTKAQDTEMKTSTNPFDTKLPEENFQEERKPFLPLTASEVPNQNLDQRGLCPEKPAPQKPLWTGCCKAVKEKALNLILKLPRPDITVLFLMLVDLVAVSILLIYDNTKGDVEFSELLFYVLSLVATVFGVLYICGTKPPRDMLVLFDKNKDLLTQYDNLEVEHTEALARQREEVEDQRLENNRLGETVTTFRQMNEGLKQNVNNLKYVTEYLVENSVEQLEAIGDNIKKLQGENAKFSEQIKEVNTDIQIMEMAMNEAQANVRRQTVVIEELQAQNECEVQSVKNQEELVDKLNDVVRVADLKDELAEIPEPGIQQTSQEVIEETENDNSTKLQISEQEV